MGVDSKYWSDFLKALGCLPKDWPAPQKLQETEFKLCADVPQKLSLSIYTNTITKQQKSSLASITPWQSHAQSLYFFPQSKHSMN